MSKTESFPQRKNRSAVTPFEVKGAISIDGDKKSSVALIWNISDTGLCIWSDSKLKKGGLVIFAIDHPWKTIFECEVIWTRSVPDRSGFILGLHVTKNVGGLIAIHKEVLKKQKKAG
jgi:hypothetical protein